MPNYPTAIIQTERLILRQWCDQDIDSYRKLNADPKVMEFFLPFGLKKKVTHRYNPRGTILKITVGENGQFLS